MGAFVPAAGVGILTNALEHFLIRWASEFLLHLADYLLEWMACTVQCSHQQKIVATARQRAQIALLRAVLVTWCDALERSACLSHAASVVRRRRNLARKWDCYNRWSDWAYTSRQHRRAALRAFDRMRVSTAAANHTVTIWKRLSVAWMETASEEMKDMSSHLRGHMTLALSRGITRSITKLLRTILREWSYFRRNSSRLREAAERALRRSRARACSAILEAWNLYLDRKSFLGLVYTRIWRRCIAAFMYSYVMLWREFAALAQRIRNRLRRLRRRVCLRFLLRVVRKWQMLTEDMWRERVALSRLIRRGRLDFLGA